MFERAEAFALERCVIANAALSQELSELWILTEARVPLSVIWGMSVERIPLVAYLSFATLGRQPIRDHSESPQTRQSQGFSANC